MTSINKQKYKNKFFIEKYAALWAYGYKNNFGQAEGLYRTVNDLVFSSFDTKKSLHILDIGCGVGRTTADCAKFFTSSRVLGIDNSKLMMTMALRLNKSKDQVMFDMRRIGFGKIFLQAENIDNLEFHLASLEEYSDNLRKNTFDIITAVNYIDRVDDVKETLETIYKLLKPSGFFIFASPLNFSNADNWEKYKLSSGVVDLAKEIGFIVDVHFDNLVYREIIDSRGAFEDYPTLILRLKK